MNKNFTAILTVVVCALMTLSFTAQAKVEKVLQQNKSFVFNGKKIEAIEVHLGDKLIFENADPFFHNIFSLSDLKSFDLGSYESGKSKSVVFDKKGKVEVECAIHPQMFLEVTVQ